MRKLLFLFSLLVSSLSYTQVASNYVFSETTGTYTSITGGTQLVTTTGGATTYDTDGSYFTLPAGSQFTYNGFLVTSVNMTADGSLWLNPSLTTTGNGVTGPIASAATSTGVIAAMAMDLRSTAIATQVYERRWQDLGSELVFQWQNAARYLQSGSERFSFQIRINETTGEIRVVYGNMTTITTSTTYQPQVGLRGSVNTDYNSRRLTGTVPDASPNWGAPNGTTAATANSHTVRFTSTAGCVPSSGLTFIWSVQSCAGPSSPIVSYTSSTTANLSWTASSSNPSSGYQWELRTSGAGGSGATGLAASGSTTAGVVTAVATSLTEQTTYILYVRSNCGSSFSGWVANTSSISPPINDNCSGSISLTVNSGTTCTSSTTRSSIGGTQSQTACSAIAAGSDDDVWFSFVATATSHVVTVTPGTMSDVVFQVFSGSCSGLSSLSCVDATAGSSVETTTLTSLTVGLTYYIRVHSYSSTNGTRGSFTICVTTACTTPTTSGTLSSDLSSTVVNDAVTFSVTGNGGSISLFEWSFDNFITVAGSTSNPTMPYTLQLNVAEPVVYFRATSTDGSCPVGVTPVISVNLEQAPPYTYGVSDGDYITNVTFSDINNNSTNDGDAYQNFQNIFGTVIAGQTYNISVSGTFTFGSYSGYATWIDWNDDGIFQTSENILIASPSATGTTSVTVPSNFSGTVKMRVLSVWNATPTNDAYYSVGYGYGEIEEYSIMSTTSLPIELVSFSGTCLESSNLIIWKTASEYNTSHFNLESSIDGENWDTVTTISAAGYSNDLINYSFTDKQFRGLTVYYNLIQFDNDGNFKKYGPISINCSDFTSGYISTFPNPSNREFSIILNDENLIGDSELVIYDESGRLIFTKELKITDGINLFNIQNVDFNPGMYFISIVNQKYSTIQLKQIIR